MHPFDDTDRLAAANLISALIQVKDPRVSVGSGNSNWDTLAEACYDCAASLATMRQRREFGRR
jgi:hypothetical protein